MTTKALLFIFSAMMLAIACKNSRQNNPMCQHHHLGNFKMVDAQNVIYTITREENQQIEKNETNGEVASYRLKWINDCTYRLTFKDGPNWLRNIWGQRILTVHISDASETEYSFQAKFSDDEQIIENTIQKLDSF